MGYLIGGAFLGLYTDFDSEDASKSVSINVTINLLRVYFLIKNIYTSDNDICNINLFLVYPHRTMILA